MQVSIFHAKNIKIFCNKFKAAFSSLLDEESENDRLLHFLIKTYKDGAITPKIKELKIGIETHLIPQTNKN